jgi:hypothetical protein
MVTKTSHKEAVVGRLRALQSRCDTSQKFKENLAQFLEAFSYFVTEGGRACKNMYLLNTKPWVH